MKILKRILLVLVLVLVVLLVVGFLLPSSVHVERAIAIDASPATVFGLINSLGEFNRWSPWADLDPEAVYTFEGPESGVGAKMSWASDDPDVGSGSQEIVESEPHRLVRVALDFGPEGTAVTSYVIEPVEEGTRVTWGFDTDFGYDLVGRYFGLFFDGLVGPDFEKGLASLKELAESLPEVPEIEEVEVEPVSIAYVAGSSTQDAEAIAAALGEAYGQVNEFMAAHALEQAGAPLAITTQWSETEDLWEYKAGMPVGGELPAAGEGAVELGTTYGGTALKAVHVGPYADIAPVYEAMDAYMAAHGLVAAGDPWEVYVSDPGETPEEELITHVYSPVTEGPMAEGPVAEEGAEEGSE